MKKVPSQQLWANPCPGPTQLEDSGEHGQLKEEAASIAPEFCAAQDTDASETEQPF